MGYSHSIEMSVAPSTGSRLVRRIIRLRIISVMGCPVEIHAYILFGTEHDWTAHGEETPTHYITSEWLKMMRNCFKTIAHRTEKYKRTKPVSIQNRLLYAAGLWGPLHRLDWPSALPMANPRPTMTYFKANIL